MVSSFVAGFLYFLAVVFMLAGIWFVLGIGNVPSPALSYPQAISNTGVGAWTGGINNSFGVLANGIDYVSGAVYASVGYNSHQISEENAGLLSFLIGMTILLFTKLSVIGSKISSRK